MKSQDIKMSRRPYKGTSVYCPSSISVCLFPSRRWSCWWRKWSAVLQAHSAQEKPCAESWSVSLQASCYQVGQIFMYKWQSWRFLFKLFFIILIYLLFHSVPDVSWHQWLWRKMVTDALGWWLFGDFPRTNAVLSYCQCKQSISLCSFASKVFNWRNTSWLLLLSSHNIMCFTELSNYHYC